MFNSTLIFITYLLLSDLIFWGVVGFVADLLSDMQIHFSHLRNLDFSKVVGNMERLKVSWQRAAPCGR